MTIKELNNSNLKESVKAKILNKAKSLVMKDSKVTLERLISIIFSAYSRPSDTYFVAKY